MIGKTEKRWLLWFTGIILVVISLPYLVGYAVQGQNWRYTGLLLGSEDGNSYYAKMMLGQSGDWLFRSPYTTFPQAGFIAFFPYLLLGKLAGGKDLYTQLGVLFHLMRLSGSALAVYTTYYFSALFLETAGSRRLATALALFGGGFGFLTLFGLGGLWQGVMKLPGEFYSPETFGFLSILAIPHLAWARGLLLLGLIFFITGTAANNRTGGLLTGVTWFLMGLMQPLTIVVGWAVLGMTLVVWRLSLARTSQPLGDWWVAFRRAIWAGLITAPIVFYNIFSFYFDPYLIRWQSQNLIPSPPPGDYLLSFGVLLPLAAATIWRWRVQLTARRWVLLAWLVVFPFLVYLPVNLQRRLAEGFWVALSIFAAAGLAGLSGRWHKLSRAWIGLAFLASLTVYIGSLMILINPGYPLFRPIGEVRAMQFLAEEANKGDVVLASYETANVLPTRAPVQVPSGLTVESVEYDAVMVKVGEFFRQDTPVLARLAVLTEFNVRYVFWGPLEKTAENWSPASLSGLTQVYQADGYEIYEVMR